MDAGHQAKASVVLLSAAQSQDAVVDLLQAPPPDAAQTVLLTQLDDATNPLHQALLHTAITAHAHAPGGGVGGATQAFIASCSELDGLNALIQEGGTEVTVVTEGNAVAAPTPAAMATAADVACCGQSEGVSQPEGAGPDRNSLLGTNVQNVVIHGVPLIVSAHAHTLYSDAHTH